MSKFCFHSISWNKFAEFHKILYMNEFILTRSRLGLLPVILCKSLTELWSLIFAQFFPTQYLENTLQEMTGNNPNLDIVCIYKDIVWDC